MNELSRHIEILLLDNDCVIVPDFGGFMAHHTPAAYLLDAGTFYPPQRTLGFNPQLKLNDSLLAQAYVEAYDISYPEAVRKIESEVEEIRQRLSMDGLYEFHGLGVITLLSDGRYDFQPCMAGLLTPSLYGLDALPLDVIREINSEATSDYYVDNRPVSVPTAIQVETHKEQSQNYTVEASGESECEDIPDGIHISYTMLRNLMAAAMLALFIIFSCIPLGLGSGSVQRCSMIDTELISSIITQTPKTVKEATSAICHNKKNSDNQNAAEAKQQSTAEQAHYFTIVLASRVSKSGAEEFVAQLKSKGMKDASVYERVKSTTRKVIYGRYSTEQEARKALSMLRSDNDDFTQAWTTEIR